MVTLWAAGRMRILAGLGLVLALAAFPVFFGGDRYVMNIAIMCLMWGIVASSWNLILGYARVFSFGHLAFFIVGGYTSGLAAVYLGLSPWLGMLLGGVAGGFLGFVVGIPCLRLHGMYLAIVTFAVHMVLPVFIVWAGPGRFENFSTGGSWGLQRIPALSLFSGPLSRHDLVPWYFIALGIFAVFAYLIYRVIKSPVGLAFVALRDSPALAKSLGVDEYKYKLMVFAISSFVAGVMGGFYAHYHGLISPATLSLETFLLALVMVLFGGLGRFPGGILGAFAIVIANELLRPLLVWRLVVLGGIVILTMTYMPNGLMSLPEALTGLKQRLGARSARARTPGDSPPRGPLPESAPRSLEKGGQP